MSAAADHVRRDSPFRAVPSRGYVTFKDCSNANALADWLRERFGDPGSDSFLRVEHIEMTGAYAVGWCYDDPVSDL